LRCGAWHELVGWSIRTARARGLCGGTTNRHGAARYQDYYKRDYSGGGGPALSTGGWLWRSCGFFGPRARVVLVVCVTERCARFGKVAWANSVIFFLPVPALPTVACCVGWGPHPRLPHLFSPHPYSSKPRMHVIRRTTQRRRCRVSWTSSGRGSPGCGTTVPAVEIEFVI